MMTSLTSVELFAGAGGLSLGAAQAGFHPLLLVERNPHAAATLRKNKHLLRVREEDIQEGDVREIAFSHLRGRVDLLSGGVPCQPFSCGGKALGMDDERDLFSEYLRAVAEIQPKVFVIENVRGLLRQKFQTYVNYILLRMQHPTLAPKKNETWEQHLARLEGRQTQRASHPRYNVVFHSVNAADYGVPQIRHRVFFVGFRGDLDVKDWSFPIATHSKLALIQEQALGVYKARQQVELATGSLSKGFPWRTIREALQGLPSFGSKASQRLNHLEPSATARQYPGHEGSILDWPSKAIKAGVHGVPGGENMIVFPDGSLRYMSVREAARLQTFPDEWVISGAWSEGMRQMGNAVPVWLAQQVFASIARAL
jgi:DNA (cytosine-5)-methyltransferase 1